MYDFLVIGGGAAGFFAAINIHKNNPGWKIGILEQQAKVLQKVKIAGGGRCNVTNVISDPEELSGYYPRGGEFLKSCFEKFSSKDTQDWFSQRGIELKAEKDGRMFPISDSSQTIIDCFMNEAKGLDIILRNRIIDIQNRGDYWMLESQKGEIYKTRNLMIAAGSDKRIWKILQSLNFKIKHEVPSLFTFNIEDPDLHRLQGVSFENATVTVEGTDLKQTNPLLITHWGLSGPVILKLSAWGAYVLNERNYQFNIKVNWLGNLEKNIIEGHLKARFLEFPKKNIKSMPIYDLPKKFWVYICNKSGIADFQKGAETGRKQIARIAENLTNCAFEVTGKSTFKEEFVTAGGIELSEITNDSFKSTKFTNLYFGGEVLNIDGITGGFNFQAAWTAGYLIAQDLKKK